MLAALSTLCILAGCGESGPPPAACAQAGPDDVARALRGAPDAARLPGGTLISACIDESEDDADLQNLGLVFVAVADGLSARAPSDERAAFQLGFLIGAAQRGAGPTGGTQAELIQRLQQTIAFRADRASVRAQVLHGIVAGRRAG
jgi:hypothetical protein